jgi:hypothetical protein
MRYHLSVWGGLKYEALPIILVVFCGPVYRCCLYRFGVGTGKGKNKYQHRICQGTG